VHERKWKVEAASSSSTANRRDDTVRAGDLLAAKTEFTAPEIRDVDLTDRGISSRFDIAAHVWQRAARCRAPFLRHARAETSRAVSHDLDGRTQPRPAQSTPRSTQPELKA